MIAAIDTILEFFSSIGALLWSFVRGIFQLISMLPSAVTMLTNSIATMPVVLTAFATGIVSISIVYLIVGR